MTTAVPRSNAGAAAGAGGDGDDNAAPGAPGAGHPAPHRNRVSPWATGFGLLGAPGAWVLQLLLAVGFASYSCYPKDVPLDRSIFGWLEPLVLIVNGTAIVVCALALWVAWRSWKKTRFERPGSGHHVMESGDGRTRFFAMTGMLASVLFLIGVVFQAFNVFVVPACS